MISGTGEQRDNCAILPFLLWKRLFYCEKMSRKKGGTAKMPSYEQTYKESRFSRNIANVAKLGAYYTDADHCRRIGMLFDFEAAEEINVLEPSVGDGSALLAVTGGRKNLNLYAVELNRTTFETHLKNNEKFAAVLNEDFLGGVKISNGVFSFCFANPPYGVQREEEGGKRLETLFLERIGWYLKADAYLVYVIPHGVFTDEKFFRQVMTRYYICECYRFDDQEYAKYHQVAVILRKKKGSMTGYLRSDFEAQYEKVRRIETIPYLPTEASQITQRYEVLPSKDCEIEYFTAKTFDAEEAYRNISGSPLYNSLGREIFQKKFSGCDLSQPIVPVSKDISYLLAVSGGGQGLAGSEEDGTLHLQRGVAKKVEVDSVNVDEKGRPKSVNARSFTQISLNIIQNDGTITQL